MVSSPIVTVIIVAYKRTNYIIDAIKSVINQQINDKSIFELIVIKNFSNEFIDKYVETSGIKNILSNDTTLLGKILEATNVAFGKFISILEDDDIFLPNKLEEIKREYELNQNLVYIHNNFDLIDENGVTIKNRNDNFKSKIISSSDIKKEINYCFSFGYHNNSCITIERSIILNNYEFLKKHKTNNWIDLSFLILSLSYLQKNGKDSCMLITNTILTQYRVHQSLSAFIPIDSNDFIHKGIEIDNNSMVLIKKFPDYLGGILGYYISSFLNTEILLFTIIDPVHYDIDRIKRVKLALNALFSKYRVITKRSRRIILIAFLSSFFGEKLVRLLLMKLLNYGKSV